MFKERKNIVSKPLIVAVCYVLFVSQIYAKSINLNISDPIRFSNKKDVLATQLKISGLINKNTISTINKLYPNIEELDLRDAQIISVTDNKIKYLANEIPKGAFIRQSKLKSITLPRGVVKIGKGSFWGCVNLEKVILPDSLKIIDQFAFQLCSKLRQITFPKSLAFIGGASFASCDLLTTLNFRSKTPPQMLEWNPFPDLKPTNCKVYVPEKSITIYSKLRFLNSFQIIALK